MLIQKGNYSNASFTKTRLRLMIKIKNTHTQPKGQQEVTGGVEGEEDSISRSEGS